MFGVVGQGYVPPEQMAANTAGRNSMPSAHAANWFAMTMVMFLFYRRSLWFMLPMALAVSFSRVYNGVHYPSDVLAGMILGAGYAAARSGGVANHLELGRKKMVSALARAECHRCLNPESRVQKSGKPNDSEPASAQILNSELSTGTFTGSASAIF